MQPLRILYGEYINNSINFENEVVFDVISFAYFLKEVLREKYITYWISRRKLENELSNYIRINQNDKDKIIEGKVPEDKIILYEVSYYKLIDKLSEVDFFEVSYKDEFQVLRLLTLY